MHLINMALELVRTSGTLMPAHFFYLCYLFTVVDTSDRLSVGKYFGNIISRIILIGNMQSIKWCKVRDTVKNQYRRHRDKDDFQLKQNENRKIRLLSTYTSSMLFIY